MINLDFYFDGEYSVDHGIYLVKMDTGFITDPFLGEREILQEIIPGRDVPYFYGVNTQPLQVKLTLSPLDGLWTLEKRREIARWLDKKQYKEFYSTDDVDRRYYLLYTDGIDLHTNGCFQGYIECTFQNISPYTYSPVYVSEYDLSDIVSPTIITFDNQGDDILRPELEITKKVNGGDLSIKNLTNGGQVFLMQNLARDEIVYFDNEHRIIKSDDLIVPAYNRFNNNYLELVRGINQLQVSNACTLTFRYQYTLKG